MKIYRFKVQGLGFRVEDQMFCIFLTLNAEPLNPEPVADYN
jgi:hypothetical protein